MLCWMTGLHWMMMTTSSNNTTTNPRVSRGVFWSGNHHAYIQEGCLLCVYIKYGGDLNTALVTSVCLMSCDTTTMRTMLFHGPLCPQDGKKKKVAVFFLLDSHNMEVVVRDDDGCGGARGDCCSLVFYNGVVEHRTTFFLTNQRKMLSYIKRRPFQFPGT